MKWLLILFACGTLAGAQDQWQTYYEKSGYKETPRYKETVAFAQQLAGNFKEISYTSFGKTPQGRDLPLLIVDKDGLTDPQAIRESGRIVLLLQAGIHAGEIDGKDAGFMMLRNMFVNGEDKELLENVSLLFIPIFNVDGHERFSPYSRANQNGPEEMGWRTTAQNYNLNRDFLKADSPEMRAWLKLYNTWLPEFLIDSHVTDGSDYAYAITFDVDLSGLMTQPLIDWSKENYIPFLKREMKTSGFPTIEYVNLIESPDPRKGLAAFPAIPRYSTGYTAIQNRVGLLVETHMFKDYKTRVDATYHMVRHTWRYLNKNHNRLYLLTQQADSLAADGSLREGDFPITFKRTGDSVMVDFWGYEFNVEESELSGGPWYRFSKDTVTWRVPFYRTFAADKFVALPRAYILPPEWLDIIERLEAHGIAFTRLAEERSVEISSYSFSDPRWRTRPYENHHLLTAKADVIEEEWLFPKGSVVIPMDQRRARVIAHILEPDGPDSFLRWGFFDPVFERKEYVELYVMEERARFMLADDPDLKRRFEQKMVSDSTFASNPRAILYWFYKQSPYWDEKLNIYPVGKIFNENVYKKLMQE